jgi:MAP3K TRAFs-binding domain
MEKKQGKGSCFVVMGFGEKTAFYGGKKKQRLLNLDSTYRHIIKPAVEAAGYECVRADEILHSTAIDKPMYERLLSADVVVADLSTSNANALYELGVRHALKPRTTVVIAEKEFAFPFDVARLNILRYEHLGPDIGAGEAKRAADDLTRRLVAIGERDEVDSPVFLFLPELVAGSSPAAERRGRPAAAAGGQSLAQVRDAFADAKRGAQKPADWLVVAERLRVWQRLQPDDPYVLQQLALATYKSEHPGKVEALLQARQVLEVLTPEVSSDAETVGLWGAIHKRLWEQRHSRDDLDEAIRAHARGFLLRDDHYNGINYAFLLDLRASLSSRDEATADRMLAARARREVLRICEGLEQLQSTRTLAENEIVGEHPYWPRASRVEALVGLGRRDEAEVAFTAAKTMKPVPEPWMIESTQQQLEKLATLLKKAEADPAAELDAGAT